MIKNLENLEEPEGGEHSLTGHCLAPCRHSLLGPMNSLAFPRGCPSPLTLASTSTSAPVTTNSPPARIKIRRPRREAHRIAARKPSRIVAMAAAAPARWDPVSTVARQFRFGTEFLNGNFLCLCSFVKEVLPSPLTSVSEPPPLFDGTTR